MGQRWPDGAVCIGITDGFMRLMNSVELLAWPGQEDSHAARERKQEVMLLIDENVTESGNEI